VGAPVKNVKKIEKKKEKKIERWVSASTSLLATCATSALYFTRLL
jgi:hypothetical protein